MLKFLIQRSEIGAGTRGSSLGPEAVKLASVRKGSSLFEDHEYDEIPDLNDALLEPTETPNALRIKQMVPTWEAQANAVKATIEGGNTPVITSADHASAGGTIAGIRLAKPDLRLGVVWVDAHADLHSPYTTPSGNIHGMPLAASIADDNQEMKVNDPSPLAVDSWEQLKNIGGLSPKISPDDIVFVGVRDTEAPENHLMEKHRIKNYEVAEVRAKGVEAIASEILQRLSDCDLIYVSYDVDSMDPEVVSYGTGTPVPGGITPEEGKTLLGTLLSDPKLCCFEIVEVNPLLDDKKNKMAETALGVLEKAVETLENR